MFVCNFQLSELFKLCVRVWQDTSASFTELTSRTERQQVLVTDGHLSTQLVHADLSPHEVIS